MVINIENIIEDGFSMELSKAFGSLDYYEMIFVSFPNNDHYNEILISFFWELDEMNQIR